MRHLTSGNFYKLFLRVVFVGALLLWTFSLFAASRDDGGPPSAGLELLSLSGLSKASGCDGEKITRLEVAYQREREERIELERSVEELLTKQQDIQGQLDILRQQIPLPEDSVDGAERPPEIGYTKWAKNYYNTRRDGVGDAGPPQTQVQQPQAEGSTLQPQDANVSATSASGPVQRDPQRSEGDQCVLPHLPDLQKNFWPAPFGGCCRGGGCGLYELRDNNRLLLSKCSEKATVSWGDQSRTVEPQQTFSLSSIPNVGSQQYVRFQCRGVEDLVVLPMTNDQAYKQAVARNSTSRPKPNVVVLMIDALSRAQFVRALPKTVALFDKLNQDPAQRFSVFDFQFFGTLGAYSPPNRHAFFSGYPLGDDQAFFQGSPFPKEEKKLRVHEKKDVWMWDVLSDAGYITYSARDMCSKSANFVYDDFISRPWTDVHFQDMYCHMRYNGHASTAEHCVKTRYAHQYVLDSGSLFHHTYTDVPRFVYLDFAEGHEPSMKIVRTMDSDLVEHLPRYLADENTIIVLASDHGIGYGKHHGSRDGPLEERLPALFVLAPNRLLTSERRQNLEANTYKLVNGVDVFETVADFAGAAVRRPWAHSLLRSMPSRNCRDAGINIHACPCKFWDGQAASRITWK